MKTLVYKDDPRCPGTLSVGWRMTAQNGEQYDAMWGNCRIGTLERLLQDIEDKYGPCNFVNERGAARTNTPEIGRLSLLGSKRY